MSAVSIITEPLTLLNSANNDSIFVITGSAGVPGSVFDFKYIGDVYQSGSFLTRLKAFPDVNYGYGIFKIKGIVDSLVSFDFIGDSTAEGSSTFHTASNSYTNLSIKFGKEFSSPGAFTQSLNEISTAPFIYVNTSLPFTQQGSISWNNYAINGINTSAKFLQSYDSPLRTYNNLRQWQYYYNLNNSVYGIQVNTFGSSGNLLSSHSIANPYFNLDGVQYAGTGIPQLSSTVDFTNVSSYTVNLYNSSTASISETVTYNISQDCGKYAAGAYKVYWLDTFGNFSSWLFNKMNSTTTTKTQTTYKKIIGKVKSNGSYPINTYSRAVVPFYTELQDKIVLNTDFLQDTDVQFLKGCFSSPCIFLEDQNGIVINSTVDTSDYVLNKRLNNKIYSLSLTFIPSNSDYRQLL